MAARDLEFFFSRASRRSRRQKARKNLPATWARRSSTFYSESFEKYVLAFAGTSHAIIITIGCHSQPLLDILCLYTTSLCDCISLAIIQRMTYIALLLHLLYGPYRGTVMGPFHIGSQMEANLRGTCAELHDEGCAIRFRALEFTLHPDAVHL